MDRNQLAWKVFRAALLYGFGFVCGVLWTSPEPFSLVYGSAIVSAPVLSKQSSIETLGVGSMLTNATRKERNEFLDVLRAGKVASLHEHDKGWPGWLKDNGGPDPQKIWYLWPEETTCRGVFGVNDGYAATRIGKIGADLSKWVCNAHALKRRGGRCLVYSFGGADKNQWDEQMMQVTGCEHHIFDFSNQCMLPGRNQSNSDCRSYKEKHEPYLKTKGLTAYHLMGLSGHDGVLKWFRSEATVKRLSSIMSMLGHTGRTIDVLKMDIEGSEYDAIPDILASGISIGVMLIEVHWPFHYGRPEINDNPQHLKLVAFHDQFFGLLERAGFAIYHVEFNIAGGPTTTEYAWVNRTMYPEYG